MTKINSGLRTFFFFIVEALLICWVLFTTCASEKFISSPLDYSCSKIEESPSPLILEQVASACQAGLRPVLKSLTSSLCTSPKKKNNNNYDIILGLLLLVSADMRVQVTDRHWQNKWNRIVCISTDEPGGSGCGIEGNNYCRVTDSRDYSLFAFLAQNVQTWRMKVYLCQMLMPMMEY